MPNRTPVAHPRLIRDLTAQFYPSSASVEAPTKVQDPESGEETLVWGVLPGHGAIPASVAPLTIQSVTAGEAVGGEATLVVNPWQIALAGLYPEITEEMRVRFEDGRLFGIRGVESDSHLQMTRLKAEEMY